jgi:hypothetical protein
MALRCSPYCLGRDLAYSRRSKAREFDGEGRQDGPSLKYRGGDGLN